MTRATGTPAASGTAVILFEPPMLQHLTTALRELGFDAQGFDDVGHAMLYIENADTLVSVVVANGGMLGVLNGADVATRLSRTYPTLPIVLADHYHGLVENNVMCLDKPWTLEDLSEQVLIMVARLPTGKPGSPTSTL